MLDTTTSRTTYHQDQMNYWFAVDNRMRRLLVWIIGILLWSTITLGAFIGSSFWIGSGWALLVFFGANLFCGIGLIVFWMLFAQRASIFHSTQFSQIPQVQEQSLIIDIPVTQEARSYSQV